MKLFVVNGASMTGDREQLSWVVLAQNPTNLNLLLPDDFEAEQIIQVADGFTGKDRRLGFSGGWIDIDRDVRALHGLPHGGELAMPGPTTAGI